MSIQPEIEDPAAPRPAEPERDAASLAADARTILDAIDLDPQAGHDALQTVRDRLERAEALLQRTAGGDVEEPQARRLRDDLVNVRDLGTTGVAGHRERLDQLTRRIQADHHRHDDRPTRSDQREPSGPVI